MKPMMKTKIYNILKNEINECLRLKPGLKCRPQNTKQVITQVITDLFFILSLFYSSFTSDNNNNNNNNK